MSTTATTTTPSPSTPPKPKKPTWKDRFLALRNIGPLFRMIWHTSPPIVVAMIILRLIRAFLPLANLWIGKIIIDEVVKAATSNARHDLNPLWTAIAIECGLVLLGLILARANSLLDAMLGDKFSNATSVRIMKHAATLDLVMFEDATFYDKLERARRQTWSRVGLMADVLNQIQDGITIIALIGGLAAFNPWLILLLAVALIPSFIGELKFSGESYTLAFQWTPERRKMDYYRFIGASDETAKELKIFGLSDYVIERFRTLAEDFYNANIKLSKRRAIWGTVLGALTTLAYYSAYIMIILEAVGGLITLGTLTFLTGTFSRLQGTLQGMFSRFQQISEDALYLKDLFDFFEIKSNVVAPENPRPFPKTITQGFQFEGVGFKYHNSDKWAIRNLNFTLHAGEKLALVGENGAGKTTLVKLLSRLYDPTEGRILLEGIDLKEYDVSELRGAIGVIFQDFVRYQMTAKENIAVGQISELDNQPEIEVSAEKSRAQEVIGRMPHKYEQMIGRRFADGVDLSGGEWQKIALARAYLRNAQLLILDEPTAALDARAEYEVFKRFAELTEGKMSVLISHRFSTVRMASRILVLEKGEQIEIGTHEELLALSGRYAELFALQAQGYR